MSQNGGIYIIFQTITQSVEKNNKSIFWPIYFPYAGYCVYIV